MMKRCFAGLLAALLICGAGATETFFTNRDDRYYHADADCDRPRASGYGQTYYPRGASGSGCEALDGERRRCGQLRLHRRFRRGLAARRAGGRGGGAGVRSLFAV